MTTQQREHEITLLRTRVAQLEHELFEQQRRTNVLTAEAQTRLYWLERWHVDLNELMADRRADRARELLRMLRGGWRRAKRLKRRVVGG